MSTGVAIVVPDEKAKAEVKNALGPVPGVRLMTRAPDDASHALMVSFLSALESSATRDRLFDLVRRVQRLVLLVGELDEQTRVFETLSSFSSQLGARFHLDPFIAPDPDALRRLVLARRAGSEKALIARAALEGESLVVWSCEPRRYEVPIASIPALARLSREAWNSFELSQSGSHLHWNLGDVDLNMDTVLEIADPDVRKEHERESRREFARYAKAIRTVREAHGLAQSQIPGLSERQVRRLEAGHTLPHSATLEKLAKAHDLSIDEYLETLAERSQARRRPR